MAAAVCHLLQSTRFNDNRRLSCCLAWLAGLVREAKMDPASQHGSSADSKVAKRLQARVAAAAVKGISSSQHAPALTDGLSRTKRKALAAAEQQRLAQTNGAEPRGSECLCRPGKLLLQSAPPWLLMRSKARAECTHLHASAVCRQHS